MGDIPQIAVLPTFSCMNLYTNSSFVMSEFHIYARAQVDFIRFLFLLIKLKAPRAYLRLVGQSHFGDFVAGLLPVSTCVCMCVLILLVDCTLADLRCNKSQPKYLICSSVITEGTKTWICNSVGTDLCSKVRCVLFQNKDRQTNGTPCQFCSRQ